MAANRSKDSATATDVQIIREILFGEHLQKLEGRIVVLEKLVAELQRENTQLRQGFETSDQSHQQHEQSNQEQFDHLNSTILDQIQQLEEQLAGEIKAENQLRKDAMSNLRQTINKSITQSQSDYQEQIGAIQETLIGHQHRGSELVASLAEALSIYLNENPVLEIE